MDPLHGQVELVLQKRLRQSALLHVLCCAERLQTEQLTAIETLMLTLVLRHEGLG